MQTNSSADREWLNPGRSFKPWPFLAALAASLMIMTVPRMPVSTDVNSGWASVLNWAPQKGLQSGTDLVFTYGPLGFLQTRYFCPEWAGVRLVTQAMVSFAVALAVCLVAWRLRIVWRCLLAGTFIFVAANIDHAVDLLFAAGLLCWGLLCLVEAGWRLRLCALALTLLAVFSALGKITFLMMACLSVAAVAAGAALRGNPWLGLGVAAGFAGGSVLGWVAAGQRLAHLGAFLVNALALSSGYDQAMAYEARPDLKWRGVVAVLGALGVVSMRALAAFEPGTRKLRWRRGLVLLWLAGLLFLVWKHGFVVAEYGHEVFFFGFVPVLVLAVQALQGSARPAEASDSAPVPAPVSEHAVAASRGAAGRLAPGWSFALWNRPWAWTCGLTAVCWVLPLLTLQMMFSGLARPNPFTHPFHVCRESLRCLWHPAGYREQMSQLDQAERRKAELPRLRETVGQASVDVFGGFQSYALLNGLNYQPRPVFQSYIAYNAALMRLNEEFYRSPAAPQYVLFELQPLLHRFGPLEDAWTLRYLLVNYEPVAAEEPFLLLKARSGLAPSVALLRKGTVRPGQLITLPAPADADLWMEIKLEPSALGRVRQFWYQSAKSRLAVWSEGGSPAPGSAANPVPGRSAVVRDGQRRITRLAAPAPMLAAGFVASPLLLDNGDVLDLYTSNRIVRPTAYSVELSPDEKQYWQKEVRFRIYRLDPQLGRCARRELAWQLRYPGFQAPPVEAVAPFQEAVTVQGRPALRLRRGGCLRFAIPAGATVATGSYGFPRGANLKDSAPGGVEFRIEEEELTDKRVRLLWTQALRFSGQLPDGVLKRFSVPLAGAGERRLLLKAISGDGGEATEAPVCWAEIQFR